MSILRRLASQIMTSLTNLKKPMKYYNLLELVQEQISIADLCSNDMERQVLKEVFLEFKEIFVKDSYDCGLTDIYIATIQTDPEASPVYIKQYCFPLACYDSLSEIIRTLKERNVTRSVHSSYNNPILGILKLNDHWCLCPDLRQLNK